MNFPFIGGGQGASRGGKTSINKYNFFENENNVGYIKKSTFCALVEQLEQEAPGLLRHYKKFFYCVNNGFTITNTLLKRVHNQNQSEYYQCDFAKGRIKVGATFHLVENFEKLILDYGYERIDLNCSFEELVEEAKKA